MPVEEQVVSIFAGTRGYLDDLDVRNVRRFEADLLDFVRARYGGLLAGIRNGESLAEDELAKAVASFKELFVADRPAAVPAAEGRDGPSTEHTEG
jgi:F-type H+-transporting ATPase subunit alpha